MRFLILLLFPFQVFGHQEPQKEKLDVKGFYETAIRDYIITHPEQITEIESTGEKIIFLRKKDFAGNLKDTLGGVKIRFIDMESDTLSEHFDHKKQKLIVLDLQPLTWKVTTIFTMIIPMETVWNVRKKRFSKPKYQNTYCQYNYSYKAEEEGTFYFFENSECKNTD